MTADELWIIAIASLVGISCSIVGVFLVLRRMSMLGDAISHSVLFGIVVAFILTSSRSVFVMLGGAAIVGLLTAYLATELNQRGRVQEDASIGITFTWLFALGVILISVFAGQVDLDQDCVLYGEIAFAPFDTVALFGIEWGPRAFVTLFFVTLANLAFLFVGYRSLATISFDPVLASSLGIRVTAWHYLLMTFVSLTTVASFESVGAILVVAMLVIPPNTAYLFAKSLGAMLFWSIVASITAAIGGFYVAKAFDGSIAAAVGCVAGLQFILAHLFVGSDSVVGRMLRRMKGAELSEEAVVIPQ